jgi:peptide deformylase
MKIVHYPHPALRYKSVLLTAIDKTVQMQAARMLELMYEAKGLGLAANQVALPYQMLVMNPSADPNQKEHERVCINPVILEHKGWVEGEEGCLSFPGLFQKVRRFKTIKVHYYNLQGQAVEVVPADSLESRILQHEIDHLHGILYIDKMGTIAKFQSRGAVQELERLYKKGQEKGEIPPDEALQQELVASAARANPSSSEIKGS